LLISARCGPKNAQRQQPRLLSKTDDQQGNAKVNVSCLDYDFASLLPLPDWYFLKIYAIVSKLNY
jgi:quinol-cytochrome oxidoreductase complex cytochrome b subunit